MINMLFFAGVLFIPAVLFMVCFKILPHEKWQIIAAFPVEKETNGIWRGINLTYYGLFNSLAVGFSVFLVFTLLGGAHIPGEIILWVVLCILAVCIPSAKIVARWVEKKSNTLTIGGASFVAFILLPWGLWLAELALKRISGVDLPVIIGLSAITIAYVFGESIGRLACVSFGCCYGKRLADMHPVWQRVFKNHCFVFQGKTKKVAYAHGYEGEPVFPIQALTSIVYWIIGALGLLLYLNGRYEAAFLATVIPSQGWRFLSEFLRADYRGETRISAYQIMGLTVMAYAVPIALYFSRPALPPPIVMDGLTSIWQPMVILCMQGIFILTFIFTGRSSVTSAHISFSVAKDKT